jgi:hypothetical protein
MTNLDKMSTGKVQRGIGLSLRLANGDAMREIYEMTASEKTRDLDVMPIGDDLYTYCLFGGW